LALQRTSYGKQPLFIDPSTAPPTTTLNSGDLDLPVTTAFQASVIRHNVFGSCFDIEVGYFQVDWAVNSSSAGPEAVFGVDPYEYETFPFDSATIRYTSGLHLGEINLRREWFDGLTLLAGFRMGELDEHYGVNAVTSTPGETITIDTRTFNHLYGYQVGADAELFDACRPLQLHVLCKTGIYYNSANQTDQVSDSLIGTSTLGASRKQAMFMGETGLLLTYRVNCHLSFRATANATWLQGVALAPEQIGTTDFYDNIATVDNRGGIFYYGGGLGAEVKF
jgi:hypothetical protein